MLNRVPETLESGDPTAAVAEPCDPPWETSLPYLLASTAFCKDMLAGKAGCGLRCQPAPYLFPVPIQCIQQTEGATEDPPPKCGTHSDDTGLPPANLKKIQPRQKIHGECSSGAENSISMHEALGFILYTTRREGEAEREQSKGCERAIIRAVWVCAARRIWSKFTQEASVRKGERCGVGASGMLVLSLGGFYFPLLRGCLAMSEYISSGLHGGKGTWYQV